MSAAQWDPLGLRAPFIGVSFRAESWWDPDLEHAPAASGGDISVDIDTAGSITFAGQNITALLGVPVSNGSITLAGQSVLSTLNAPVSNGSITFAGQSVTATLGVPIGTQGSIVFAGQSVTSSIATVFTIDVAGSITFAGQSITATIGVPVTNGSITFAGQSVTATESVPLAAGAIGFTGQTITSTLSAPISAGSVTFNGQDITASFTGSQNVTIDVEGSIFITGQTIGSQITGQGAEPTLGPWGPNEGRPVRSMFDASTPRRRKKALPEVEIPPPVAEAPLPRPAPLPEPEPFATPLADLINLETRLALTAAQVERAAKRKRAEDEADQVVALLAAWLMMHD